METQFKPTEVEAACVARREERATEGAATVEAGAPQTEELRTLARRYRYLRATAFAAIILPCVAVGSGGWYAVFRLLAPWLGDDPAAGSAMGIYLLVMLSLLLVGLRVVGRRYAERVRRLTRGQGSEAVGPLLELLRADMRPGRSRWAPLIGVLTEVLVDKLPQLRASDANLLTDRHRAILNEILARCARYHSLPGLKLIARARARLFRPPLVVAVLQALEQVGDARAVPYVERLTRLTGRAPTERQICEAARSCLPLLKANAQHVDAVRTLLRPAEATGGEGLLRPAEGAAPSDPHVLLRPAE